MLIVFENANSTSIFGPFNIEMYTFGHGLHECIFSIKITVKYTHNSGNYMLKNCWKGQFNLENFIFRQYFMFHSICICCGFSIVTVGNKVWVWSRWLLKTSRQGGTLQVFSLRKTRHRLRMPLTSRIKALLLSWFNKRFNKMYRRSSQWSCHLRYALC